MIQTYGRDMTMKKSGPLRRRYCAGVPCGLKHYKWYIQSRTVSCTVKPLVGQETTVYCLSDTLTEKANDFL